MENDHRNPMADREQRRDRKRVQNREAQRTYRNRMKQRVEDLERQVDDYRRQAQSRGNSNADDVGGAGQTPGRLSKEASTTGSGDAAANDSIVARGSRNSVTVATEWPRSSRKRTRQAAPDSLDDPGQDMPVSDGGAGLGKPLNPIESKATARDAAQASPPPPSPRRPSQARFAPQAPSAGSRVDEKSPAPRDEARHADGSSGQAPAPAPSEDLSALLADDLAGRAPPLQSPSSSGEAYINPNMLSQMGGHEAGPAPFGPPYYPLSMPPNMGMYPPPYSNYPLYPHGQFPPPSSQDWPWCTLPRHHDHRRGTLDSQFSQLDKYEPGTSGPKPDSVPAVSAPVITAGRDTIPSQPPQVSPTETHRDEGMNWEELREQLSLDPDPDPDPGAISESSSPCGSDFADSAFGSLPLPDAEKNEELRRVLQGLLDCLGGGNCDNPGAERGNSGGQSNLGGRPQTVPSHPKTLEDRFDVMQLCAEAMGFSSIDAMLGEYYTAPLDPNSTAFRHQRISRQIHLPDIVAGLRRSTQDWNSWDSHAYYHELMRSTIALIHEERDKFVASSDVFAAARTELDKLVSEASRNGAAAQSNLLPSAKAFSYLSKMMHTTMPRLWTLVEDLENLDKLASDRRRLYTSLAITLLLSCSGEDSELKPNSLAIGCLCLADVPS